MPGRQRSVRRPAAVLFFIYALIVLAPVTPARAVEIEGVQPAALDQPRINICLRREMKGQPLAAAAGNNDRILRDLLGGGAGAAGGGAGQTINVQAFLDTGASGILLSKNTAAALGIKRATAAGGKEVVFHDIGVGGSEAFGVSEPLFVAVAPNLGNGSPDHADGYGAPFGPVRAQINTAGGLIEQLTGGLDVVGMPAMKGKIVVLDPRPVDTFGDTMRAALLDARRDRRSVPKVDRTVVLTYASFARFTHTEPAGAQGPNLADNPFIGPSPVAGAANAGRGAKPHGAAPPPVVITLDGKTASGSWLLDTGASASMISTAQAKALGVTYVEGTQDGGNPKLAGAPEADQFTFTIGGVGGQKTVAGFFLDTLTLPTRERDPIVYKRAPVLVADITVTDPKTQEQVTLDGVLGMNFFVASANIKQTGLLPDINQLTACAYEQLVFDEPAGTLGLKLKPEFVKAGAGMNGSKRGTIEIKPSKSRQTR